MNTVSNTDQNAHTRRRAPEERPQQILEAALHEFAKRGLAGARLDDIAKRAGIAKGTIYLYFPNKEALFREMVKVSIVDALNEAEATERAQKSDSAESRLRSLASGWWHFLRTDQVHVIHKLVHAELANFPDLMAYYAEEVIAKGRRMVSGIIVDGIASGEFRPLNPAIASRMYSAIWLQHSTWCSTRAFHQQLGSDAEVLSEMLDFYLYALRP